MTYFKPIFPGLLLVWINGLPAFSQAPHSSGYLTRDGAWCWFSDPRAIVVKGKVYTGWVKKDGTIEAAAVDLKSGSVETDALYPELDKDDHANPAFVAAPGGKGLALYTKHPCVAARCVWARARSITAKRCSWTRTTRGN